MRRLTFAALLLIYGCSPESEIPVYYTAPDFSLTERSGRNVTREDLSGKVWIADFIFTSCAGTCPLMTERMRKLQEALPPEIRLVSFTVDPSRDTPAVLERYAKQYEADPERWLFLTGSEDVMHKLSIEGFKLALDATVGTDVEPITHSTRFVLVDREGQIRGYYSGTEDEALERLAGDAKKLL